MLGVLACGNGTAEPAPAANVQPTVAASAGASRAPDATPTDGAAPASGELAAAIARTRATGIYRMSAEIVTSASSGETTKTDVFVRYEAEFRDGASRMVFDRGAFNDLIGGGKRIEIVNKDRRSYLRGSTLYGTVEPDRWYSLSEGALLPPPFDGWQLLSATRADSSRMRFAGNIAMDGMTCAARTASFIGDGTALIELSVRGANGDFSRVDQADVRLVLCPDGFVHALDFTVSAHIPDAPSERTATAIALRYYDFNAADIIVSAPAGAVEVQ